MSSNFNKNNQQLKKDSQLSGLKVWKRKDGIIVAKFWGIQKEENAQLFVKKMLKIGMTKRKIKLLVDATESHTLVGSRTRKVYVELGKKIKTEKIAIFGSSSLIKVVANFIIRAVSEKLNIGEVKFFSTEEEALKWLKEEKQYGESGKSKS